MGRMVSVFLLSGCVFIAVSLCPDHLLAADTVPDRPNILWISCEDISPNLGCYGDAYARTPVLDELARQGVLYTNAFGVTGVCAPNRSCLITGVYPSTLGSSDMRSTTRLPDHIQCFSEYLRSAGYFCTNNSKTDYNFPTPKTAWDESSGKAHWRRREPGQPFFSVFNFTVCHESQIRQGDASFFKKTARLTPDQRHDPARVPLPPFHPDTPEVRQDWARYHDLITAMDYQAGDVLKQLEEDDLAENTIVFYFSDHGAGMPGCKKWVWESGLHVPFIVRFPEKYADWSPGKPGTKTDRLVSFVDLAATVLSLAGVPIPKHMQGRAFLGAAADEPREYVYAIRDRMAERYDTVRVVRDTRFQYIRNFQPHRSSTV
jgi:arylsulfatase A-like enzyme